MFEMQQLASECPVYGHSKLDSKVFHHSTANGLSLNETISILELAHKTTPVITGQLRVISREPNQ